MRRIFCLFITVCTIFMLNGCGQKHICRKCEKAVSNAYYDIDGDIAYCKDCAKDYWAPFDYEEYRVKD